MLNIFNNDTAKDLDDLELRVYTSQLLGANQDLVLHGGGNTSVKINKTLYVKGSGWDLATIQSAGFSPVDLDTLISMAKLESISDTEMVRQQKAAMSNQDAPNPSVEAILHALIPYKFVDHTHADAIVTISNSVRGKELIRTLYKDFLIVDYIMPGFELAHKIYNMTKELDWGKIKGIILHNHGIFTFDNDGKKSYDKMIESVNIAERYLEDNTKISFNVESDSIKNFNMQKLEKILEQKLPFSPVLELNTSPLAMYFVTRDDVDIVSQKGVLTPEHVLRLKRTPLVLDVNDDIEERLEEFKKNYISYFNKYKNGHILLNPYPNWIIFKNFGIISIGKDSKSANIIKDISTHTINAILKAELLGGYVSISEQDTFNIEYWELEQAKLK